MLAPLGAVFPKNRHQTSQPRVPALRHLVSRALPSRGSSVVGVPGSVSYSAVVPGTACQARVDTRCSHTFDLHDGSSSHQRVHEHTTAEAKLKFADGVRQWRTARRGARRPMVTPTSAWRRLERRRQASWVSTFCFFAAIGRGCRPSAAPPKIAAKNGEVDSQGKLLDFVTDTTVTDPSFPFSDPCLS